MKYSESVHKERTVSQKRKKEQKLREGGNRKEEGNVARKS